MAFAAKSFGPVIPWALLALGLARAFAGRTRDLAMGSTAGITIGAIVGFQLFTSLADPAYASVKSVVAAAFIALFVVAAWAWYGAPTVTEAAPSKKPVAVTTSFVVALLFAVLNSSRLPLNGDHGGLSALVATLLALGVQWLALYLLEPLLPGDMKVPRGGLSLLVVSLFLFTVSLSPRLDLFAPLSMKVMKFTHDFVHQFFESMLIPDHPFFRRDVWDYIGLLFSNSVGFWGALALWVIPPVWITAAVFRLPLPSVAHLRQGALRRKTTAAHLRQRRWRLVFPLVSSLIMAAAVYKSCNPSVEYWDPKPVAVKPDGTGEITIPLKSGEIDLNDGKLHKYQFPHGAEKVRFFVIHRSGALTVTLDACSICQPQGYGQGDGTVICYYCKTLIPIETVGKPGGCNPVPVPFTVDGNGVHVSADKLANVWANQVQAEKKVPGGGNK